MRNKVKINKNERSWAIEMISLINSIVEKNDLIIKRAGGECTVTSHSRTKMFPDVILYKDENQTTLIQGWELKMPDVPITNDLFVADAKRKARTLGLNSCVIWNFTYAKLLVFNPENRQFEVVKSWEHKNIKTREDVAKYHREWEITLKDVVLTVNDYLIHQRVVSISIEDIISENAIDILINENKDIVKRVLKQASVKNAIIEAEISEWWNGVRNEYRFDENDSYSAYSKNMILNWSYRILFAHLIKRYQNEAYLIDNLNYQSTPMEANEIFQSITERCDFFNVFSPIPHNDMLPNETWQSLIELSMFLKANGINKIEQRLLQNILENCVNTTRRELNGQFTTPRVLAEILARITIHDWTTDCLDPCCGTGTIAKEILERKISRLGIDRAIATTWASDKYNVPLQIANISLTTSDSIYKANKLFKHNALSLNSGDKISIVDPSDGAEILHALPLFGSICSNLPFVSFENIPSDDQYIINKSTSRFKLDGKADLRFHIALHLSEMLKSDGFMGVIISNSWLGTKSGKLFYLELEKRFNILQVHISGKGRWFNNADVVATILVLQKKGVYTLPNIRFYIWQKSLAELGSNIHFRETLVNSILLNRNKNNDILSSCEYTTDDIKELLELGLSFNSLFHNVLWILDIKGILCPIEGNFNVIRGSRRGWDKLFFPENHDKIEEPFLIPALFNARRVDYLVTEPDRMAFCCGKDLVDLEQNYPHAYCHIMKFIDEKNKVGRPLPEVLKRPNEKWYEMKPTEISQIFTLMNPMIGYSLVDFNLLHSLINV